MYPGSFRRWCSPRTVLLVVAPTDDPAQVLTAARYAQQSGAKLLLVQTDSERHGGGRTGSEPRSIPRSVPLNKLWRKRDSENALMSMDILRRAFVLNAVSDHEIPALVRTFHVDRVLVTQNRQAQHLAPTGIAERLIPISPVPVWIMGPGMECNLATPPMARRILLAVTRSPEEEGALQFAWELAVTEGASLSVLHLVRPSLGHQDREDKGPGTGISWLPLERLAASSSISLMEVAVRQGDPATEILQYNVRKPHDLVVLRPSPAPRRIGPAEPSVVTRLCSQMPCPLLVLGGSIERLAHRTELDDARTSQAQTELGRDRVEWES